MSKTVVYIYAMTNDTGFAPCIDNRLLTLACCKGGVKGGMRMSAAREVESGNDVYVLGLCGKRIAKTGNMLYRPVYLAKIDKAILMEQYYAEGGLSEGRTDDVYELVADALEHKGGNLPHCDSEHTQAKDIGGQYVLRSRQFAYWGGKCGESGLEIEGEFPEIFDAIRSRRSFRGYNVKRDFGEFEEKLKNWGWFPKKSDRCNIIGEQFLNGDSIGGGCK
jgi:hypothetical protein